jgi:uncharacterized membrane protein
VQLNTIRLHTAPVVEAALELEVKATTELVVVQVQAAMELQAVAANLAQTVRAADRENRFQTVTVMDLPAAAATVAAVAAVALTKAVVGAVEAQYELSGVQVEHTQALALLINKIGE